MTGGLHDHRVHNHGRGSSGPERAQGQRGLALALGITVTFLVVEGIGGLLTNSLALLADAGHMLSDVAALGLALFALWFARRPHTHQRTYGYLRTEVLAALLNGVALTLVALWILVQATERLRDPPVVDSLPMLLVALGGLGANAASAVVLRRSAGESLNVRGAFFHVLSDLLGSAGAVAAGVLMLAFGWYLADPIISLLVVALIMVNAMRLLRETVHVLLEGTPAGVDIQALEQAMTGLPGVAAVHDLHAWTITSGYNAMSAHVVVEPGTRGVQREGLLREIQRRVQGRFPIQHMTIQVEESWETCEEAHPVGSAQDQPSQDNTDRRTEGEGSGA